jgi:3'-phosphoadenosine 5'-phosphosulfate sulfotransferase (PAPS reductase)/FAD synthetase
MKLQPLIDQAVEIIGELQTVSVRPMLAYSGGKDSVVVAHIIKEAGLMNYIKDAVCETSFYFEKQLEDIKVFSGQLGWNVTFKDSLGWDWLRRYPEVIFSNDPSIRGWSFAQRHQKTVADYARTHGNDAIIFGRRTEENTVPSHLYYRKQIGSWSCHPIREWTTQNVWDYFELFDLPIPWIYTKSFGKYSGNSPFYSLRARYVGGVDEAWATVTELDPTINKQRMEI